MRNTGADENFAKQSCSNRPTCVLCSGSQLAKSVTGRPKSCEDQAESPQGSDKCHPFVRTNDRWLSSPHGHVLGGGNPSVRS